MRRLFKCSPKTPAPVPHSTAPPSSPPFESATRQLRPVADTAFFFKQTAPTRTLRSAWFCSNCSPTQHSSSCASYHPGACPYQEACSVSPSPQTHPFWSFSKTPSAAAASTRSTCRLSCSLQPSIPLTSAFETRRWPWSFVRAHVLPSTAAPGPVTASLQSRVTPSCFSSSYFAAAAAAAAVAAAAAAAAAFRAVTSFAASKAAPQGLRLR